MQEYDYRISDEAVNNVSRQIDRLENRQLLKLKKYVDHIEQADKEERFAVARKYFDATILPALQDFADITCSLLLIDECDNQCAILATIRNKEGFDISESCKVMRGLLTMANCISIGLEDGEPALVLVFDFGNLMA